MDPQTINLYELKAIYSMIFERNHDEVHLFEEGDFSQNFTKSLFKACRDGKSLEIIDVTAELKKQKLLEGTDWFTTLITQEGVTNCCIPIRKILEALREIRYERENAEFVGSKGADHDERLQERIMENARLKVSADVGMEVLIEKMKEGINVTPTGFSNLDRMLNGGVEDGGVFVLAARPGNFKTTMAVNIAKNMVGQGKTVLFCSLEMAPERILERFFQCRGKQTKEQVYATIDSIPKLKGELLISNPPYEISRVIAEMTRNLYADCFIIDYYQLIKGAGRNGRVDELRDISNQIKEFAFRHKKPVILLAQLNRNIEGSERKPMLSDLKGCSALEQDATAVAFLHRTSYVEKEILELDFVLRKNRNGRVGDLGLEIEPAKMYIKESLFT